ncbi:hypothetical protein [Streptomyces sp. NPDC059781]|uniref:hypothetical protein n=1 Tax=Streptomyces sp. NPDC059781 TaxID=3346943 RepID=UPI00365F5E2D
MDVLDGDYINADNEWDELLWLWQRTEAPKGCRVELVEGLVTVAPLVRVRHQVIAARVHRRLCETVPEPGEFIRAAPSPCRPGSGSTCRTSQSYRRERTTGATTASCPRW